MFSGISPLSDSDFARAGGEFSFTGKLSEIVKNSDWTDGYEAVRSGDSSLRNGYSFMWEAISAAAETPGNELYTSIRNYVDNIGNIDTCGISAIKNVMAELKFSDSTLSLDFRFPKEIRELIEIFSVNTAYVANKASDRTEDTLKLDNSILCSKTLAKIADASTDSEKYSKLARDVFYNTLRKFITLKVGETGRETSTLSPTDEIWRINVSMLANSMWDDDVSSERSVYETKEMLGVDKSFTEKIYADDIIAGRRSIDDFEENEQTVIKAEIASRETRYGTDSTLSHYYMRLYKVIEYFRFTTSSYRNAYTTSDYDLDSEKFIVKDRDGTEKPLIRSQFGEYEIDDDVVMSVASWLADYSVEIRNLRNRLKKVAQKNMLTGTKSVITDSIREFLLQHIDAETWQNLRNSTLFGAGLNSGFEVSVVEYVDPTEYFNVDNGLGLPPPDVVESNGQYWRGMYDESNSIGRDDILDFYNRLAESKTAFSSNVEAGADENDATNLYEFLTSLFEMGATNATASDLNRDTVSYRLNKNSRPTPISAKNANSEYALGAIRKYSGDSELGEEPYLNSKNSFFTSYQAHQFLGAFDEYVHAVTGIMNLVNSFSNHIADSWSRLRKRVDSLGNTINFWLNWNEDFTGYSSWFEKGGDDYDAKINQDSPFNFDALEAFLASDSYISTLLDKTNEYYISDKTGKFMLTDDETRLEATRLRKFRDEIKSIRGREIYRYGCDNYGNTYMLYKDSGNRSNRDALGDMWVRLDKHPIAFPMFSVSDDGNTFDETSCVRSTNNAKLMGVLSNNAVRFEREYGTDESSRVDLSNITVASISSTQSEIIKQDEYGNPKGTVSPEKCSSYERGDSYSLVNLNFEVNDGESFTYYVDMSNGLEIPKGTTVTKIRKLDGGGTETTTCTASANPFGSTSSVYAAEFKDGKVVVYSRKGPFAFSRFTSDYDNDPDTMFFYTGSDGLKHSLAQHTVSIESVFESRFDCLSGSYGRNGDALIDSSVPSTSVTSSVSSLSSLGVVQTVDGSVIYEDFASYPSEAYSVRTDAGYEQSDIDRVNGCLRGDAPLSGFVAYVGGNPTYIEQFADTSAMQYPPWCAGRHYSVGERVSNAGSDGIALDYRCKTENSDSFFYSEKWTEVGKHDERDDDRKVLYPPSAFRLSVRDGYSLERSFRFDKKYQYYQADEQHGTLLRKFSIGDITYAKTSGLLEDTVRPFYSSGGSNVYYPYTEISNLVLDKDDESISSIESPLQSITVNGTKLYYKVIPDSDGNVCVYGCEIDSNVVVSEMTTVRAKFGGKVVLYKEEFDKRPIELSFSETELCENSMHYSSLYNSSDQRKFNDFTFSYDQKTMLLNCAVGDGTYCESGVIVGKIVEDSKHEKRDSVDFSRDNLRNLDGIDASYGSGGAFHVGDAYNHDCMFSVYGKIAADADGSSALKLTIYSFAGNSVDVTSYDGELKFVPHEFDEYGRSRYSFKASATEDRLYVSFTCDTPQPNEKVGNTINGKSTGTVGTAKFGNISKYCGDSVVTILSFDVTSPSEPRIKKEETRYIMQNGELGYLPQFSCVAGKNVIFHNDKLDNDIRYPFYAQFDAFDSDSSSNLLSTIPATGGCPSVSLRKFVPIYGDGSDDGSKNRVRGFAIEDGGLRRTLYASIDTVAGSGAYVVSGYDGVYDISNCRYSDSEEQYRTVSIVANRSEYASYVPGFVFSSRNTAFDAKKELLYGSTEKLARTDFSEFADSENCIYALHSDGKTVSRLEIENSSGKMVRTGAVEMESLNSTFGSDSVSGFIGDTDIVTNGCSFCAFSKMPSHSDVGSILYVNDSNWGEYSKDGFPSNGKCVAIHVKTSELLNYSSDYYIRVSDLVSFSSSEQGWATRGGDLVPGVPLSSGSETASSSWSGRSATAALMSFASVTGDTYPAASYATASELKVAGNSMNGFVGTKLQLRELANNYSEIRKTLSERFGLAIPETLEGLWTSTQSDASNSVYLSSGATFANGNVHESRHVLPFFANVGSISSHFDAFYASDDGLYAANACWELSQSYTSVFTMFVDFGGCSYPHAVAFGQDFVIVYRFPSLDGFGSTVFRKVTDDAAISRFGTERFTSFARTSDSSHLVFTHNGDSATLSLEIGYGADELPSVSMHWNDDVLYELGGKTVCGISVANSFVFNLFSVNCGDRAYVMYVDKNITFSGSKAERSMLFDSDGKTEIVPTSVGRCYSFGSLVAVDCNVGTADRGESYVMVSGDFGRTFVKDENTLGIGIRLISASKGLLFGQEHSDGVLVCTHDGKNWTADGRFVPGEWRSVSTANNTYMLCGTPGPSDFDTKHRVRISSQTTVDSASPYDSLCVDDYGNVVLYGGLAGGTMRMARSKQPSKSDGGAIAFETFEFSVVRCEYSSACLYEGSVFFAPTYSTNVLVVDGATDFSSRPSLRYVDVSRELNNKSTFFNGFAVMNGTLVMYPRDGAKILAYSPNEGRFFNYYTNSTDLEFADADSIGTEGDRELLFIPSNASQDGSICFSKTNFCGRNDYGIVELDNGFPIMVRYCLMSGDESVQWGGGDTYKFTFTLLNDASRGSISVITVPKGYHGGAAAFKAAFPDSVSKSCVYAIDGESIAYSFETVDETTKYCIRRHSVITTEETTEIANSLSFTYMSDGNARKRPMVTYSTKTANTSAFASVVGGFAGFNPGDPEELEEHRNISLLPNTEFGSCQISSFRSYITSDTATFSGMFDVLRPYNPISCMDCNFNFTSPSALLKSAEEMFSGCENASFSNALVMSSVPFRHGGRTVNITSTAGMFRNCHAAALPSVDIGNAESVVNCDAMFYGCANASLDGVTIPPAAKSANDMFSGCVNATIDSVECIPDGVIGMSGMFEGCSKATLRNFSFAGMEFCEPADGVYYVNADTMREHSFANYPVSAYGNCLAVHIATDVLVDKKQDFYIRACDISNELFFSKKNKWQTTNELISTVTTSILSSDTAAWNGSDATSAMVYSGVSPVASSTSGEIMYFDGKPYCGFIGTLLQHKELFSRLDAISDDMLVIQWTFISKHRGSEFWTSTQKDTSNAYSFSNGTSSFSAKASEKFVIPMFNPNMPSTIAEYHDATLKAVDNFEWNEGDDIISAFTASSVGADEYIRLREQT